MICRIIRTVSMNKIRKRPINIMPETRATKRRLEPALKCTKEGRWTIRVKNEVRVDRS